MGEQNGRTESIASADGVTEREPSLPASEEGTGMIPEDDGTEAGDTHLPASEADTSLVEAKDEGPPPQSWPGLGGPGTIPPPG